MTGDDLREKLGRIRAEPNLANREADYGRLIEQAAAELEALRERVRELEEPWEPEPVKSTTYVKTGPGPRTYLAAEAAKGGETE